MSEVREYAVPTEHRMEAQRRFPPVIDATIVDDWRQCNWLAYVKHFCGWRKAGELSRHLDFGNALARGIQVTRQAFFDDGRGEEQSIVDGTRAVMEQWGSIPATLESGPPSVRAKTLNAALCSHALYFQRWPLPTDEIQPMRLASGKAAVEVVTSVPLEGAPRNPETGEKLRYALRPDMVGLLQGTWIVGVDEKTTTRFGEHWGETYTTRGQFLGYTWGLRQLGLDCKGMICRGVRVTAFDEIEFAEVPIFATQSTLALWHADLLETVHEMVAAWRRGSWRRAWGTACGSYGGCEMIAHRVCVQDDPRDWIGPPHREVRFWDPLEVR